MKKFRSWRKNTVLCYAAVSLGVGLCVTALNFFLIPFNIAPGGFSGIATIVFRITGEKVPVGFTMFILNVPLFIAAYKLLGRTFALRTLYALILYSALADILPVYALGSGDVISSVYGGVIMGAGLGIVIYFGACTGGTDLLAVIINRRVRTMSTGALLFIIDGLVVVASCFVFGIQPALLAVVTVYLTSKIIGFMTEGVAAGGAYIILSSKSTAIKNRIQKELDRGVTELYARGGYSETDFFALICAVDHRSEAAALQKIITDEDPRAFFLAMPAREIRGEGFSDK